MIKVNYLLLIILLPILSGCFQSGPMTYIQRESIVANTAPCNHKKVRKQSMHPSDSYPSWCNECLHDIPWEGYTYYCNICDYDRCETCNTRIFNAELRRLNLWWYWKLLPTPTNLTPITTWFIRIPATFSRPVVPATSVERLPTWGYAELLFSNCTRLSRANRTTTSIDRIDR